MVLKRQQLHVCDNTLHIQSLSEHMKANKYPNETGDETNCDRCRIIYDKPILGTSTICCS